MLPELIIGIIGVCSILLGIIKVRDNKHLKNNGIKAKGIVYAVEWKGNMCYPIVRFRTNKEVWITKKLDIGTNPPQYSEGANIILIYDPDDPETVNFDSSFNLVLVPISFIVIGIVSVVYVFLSFFDLI